MTARSHPGTGVGMYRQFEKTIRDRAQHGNWEMGGNYRSVERSLSVQ